MAVKSRVVADSELIVQPIYDAESRMRNYAIVYDADNKLLRCGFYTNKLKDKSSEYDEIYEVPVEHEHRLDLISYKFYGTATLDWAIADANNLSDPIKDVTVGTKLRIPSRNII